MPFCTQCGGQVLATDLFCAKCGTRQAVPAPPQPSEFLSNISPRTASMLCYIPILGWIPSIVVLASPRFRQERTVRFHAFQGLYLFVVWLLLDWVFVPFSHAFPHGRAPFHALAGLLHLAVFAAWILMIVKTAQDEMFRLPVVGDLAERSLAEQL